MPAALPRLVAKNGWVYRARRPSYQDISSSLRKKLTFSQMGGWGRGGPILRSLPPKEHGGSL